MSARSAAPSIVGRERELEAVAPFLDAVDDRFGALLFDGPPGIGKTTLWEAAVATARERGHRVVVSRPTEVETALVFAALNDLFADLAEDGLADLPEPQRVALEAALLRVPAASPPEPLAVSVAARHVIRQAAAARPLILAIDDIQWLDEPTARVLDFVLRRLDDEPVGLIASRRTIDDSEPIVAMPGTPAERVTRIDVRPLSIDAVDRLLRARLRLHAVAGGNPFYALELGRSLGGGPGRTDPDALAVPPSLDALVADRLADLDAETESVVLTAAATSHPTVELLGAALGDEAGPAIGRAEAAGVLERQGGILRFSHPLLAAAAYGRATEERLRDVHRRLAEVVAEREERARHLARAITEPDAAVSAALEDAAVSVTRRGAPDSAAALAERAADLTPSDDRAAVRRRLALAADQHIAGGDVERARRQLERLVDASEGPAERSEALARLAHFLLVQAEWGEAREMYREAASIVDDDPARRIPIELGLAGVAYVTWQDRPAGARHAAEALRLAEAHPDPVVHFQTLGHAASWRNVTGDDWRELMDRADRLAPTVGDVPGIEHPDLQFVRLLRDAGNFDEARRRIERLVDRAAERGDWHSLPRLLSSQAGIDARTGDLDRAERVLQDAATGVLQTGEGAWMDNLNVLAHWIAVVRGDVDRARVIEERTRVRLAANPLLAQERWSIALGTAELEFARGDTSRAYAELTPLLETIATVSLKSAFVCEVVVLAIDVLVALGRSSEAATLAEGHLDRLRASAVAWIAAEADRAAAALMAATGDTGSAMSRSDRGLALARSAGMPFVLARALLTAGEIRRRGRQKARARDALTEAVEVFDRLGARIWAERARSELARVATRREPGAPLTATERGVADLVAAGRTNKEIADALFMSVHTVEAHLTRLFRTLGIQSRTELARMVIEGTDPHLAAADPDPDSSGGPATNI
jgi:DNA-binding CsgD family transcriptional regulator/DNA polymerase III delta prime subunit